MRKNNIQKNRGFTLIEIMVALSIFSIIMTISMGSILSVFDANKKSQSLRAVMDNLNVTLEGITRTIRFGAVFHCGGGDTSSPADCLSGSNTMTVKASSGAFTTYRLSSGRIIRTVGGTDYFLTSPDVTVTNLSFRIIGSSPSDSLQPEAIIVIG